MEPTGIVSALPNEASLGRLQSWLGLSGLAERVLFGFYPRLFPAGSFPPPGRFGQPERGGSSYLAAAAGSSSPSRLFSTFGLLYVL